MPQPRGRKLARSLPADVFLSTGLRWASSVQTDGMRTLISGALPGAPDCCERLMGHEGGSCVFFVKMSGQGNANIVRKRMEIDVSCLFPAWPNASMNHPAFLVSRHQTLNTVENPCSSRFVLGSDCAGCSAQIDEMAVRVGCPTIRFIP